MIFIDPSQSKIFVVSLTLSNPNRNRNPLYIKIVSISISLYPYLYIHISISISLYPYLYIHISISISLYPYRYITLSIQIQTIYIQYIGRQMGTSLTSIRQTLNDTAQDRQTQETVQLLYENAQRDIKQFTNKVLFQASQFKQMEVRKQLISYSDIKIKLSKASDHKDEIKQIISSFANGDVIQGVTKLIQEALDTVLGNFSAGRCKKVFSLITLGKMGSLIRIDYLLSGYEFKGKSLRTIMKNVVVFCYIISSVKKEDIKYNDIQALIDLQYDHLKLEEKQKMLQRTMKSLFKKDKQKSIGDQKSLKAARLDEVDQKQKIDEKNDNQQK